VNSNRQATPPHARDPATMWYLLLIDY